MGDTAIIILAMLSATIGYLLGQYCKGAITRFAGAFILSVSFGVMGFYVYGALRGVTL